MVHAATFVVAALIGTLAMAPPDGARTGREDVAGVPSGPVSLVSTLPACPLPLLGSADYGSQKRTETDTRKSLGWVGADLGYSFTYLGKLWFLFGDTHATSTSPKGPRPRCLTRRTAGATRRRSTHRPTTTIRWVTPLRRPSGSPSCSPSLSPTCPMPSRRWRPAPTRTRRSPMPVNR